MWNCPKCGYNHVDGDKCPYCGNDSETDTGMENIPFPLSSKTTESTWLCYLCYTKNSSKKNSCNFCGNDNKNIFSNFTKDILSDIINDNKLYGIQMFVRWTLFTFALKIEPKNPEKFVSRLRKELSEDNYKILDSRIKETIVDINKKMGKYHNFEPDSAFLVPTFFFMISNLLPNFIKLIKMAETEANFICKKIKYDKEKLIKEKFNEKEYSSIKPLTDYDEEQYEKIVKVHVAMRESADTLVEKLDSFNLDSLSDNN